MNTYRYADIVLMVSKQFPSPLVEQFQGIVCNLATNLIWYSYDWRESIETLLPFYLVPNEQDIKPPTNAIPADFQGFRKVSMCQYGQGKNGGGTSKYTITIEKDIQLTQARGLPTVVSYEPETHGFRVFPRTPANIGAPFYWIEGTYKKKPALITNATMNTLFPFDDMYLQVFLEVFRWGFMAVAGSKDAGGVSMSNGQVYYDGQLGKAMGMIKEMANDQGINDGDVYVSPEEGLVGNSYGSGAPDQGFYGFWG